jgi:hypothetical protein
VVFVDHGIVLMIRPPACSARKNEPARQTHAASPTSACWRWLLLAPLLGLYPVFVMKLLCFALFACAFNLLLGYTACCRSAMRPSSARRPMSPAGHQVARLDARTWPAGRRLAAAALLAWVIGWWPSAARASTSP